LGELAKELVVGVLGFFAKALVPAVPDGKSATKLEVVRTSILADRFGLETKGLFEPVASGKPLNFGPDNAVLDALGVRIGADFLGFGEEVAQFGPRASQGNFRSHDADETLGLGGDVTDGVGVDDAACQDLLGAALDRGLRTARRDVDDARAAAQRADEARAAARGAAGLLAEKAAAARERFDAALAVSPFFTADGVAMAVSPTSRARTPPSTPLTA
jgi:hypothetical protein